MLGILVSVVDVSLVQELNVFNITSVIYWNERPAKKIEKVTEFIIAPLIDDALICICVWRMRISVARGHRGAFLLILELDLFWRPLTSKKGKHVFKRITFDFFYKHTGNSFKKVGAFANLWENFILFILLIAFK